MKKILLVSLLLLALVFTVVACKDDPVEPTDTTAGETTGTVEDPTAAPADDTTAKTEDPTEGPEVTTEKPEDPTEPPPAATTEKPEDPTDPPEDPTDPPVTEPVDPDAPISMFDAAALKDNVGPGDSGIASRELSEDGSYITITPSNSDPNYYPFANVTGGRYVAIKYRTSTAAGTALQFYLASAGQGPSDDTSMLRQSIIADGNWQVAIFDTQSLIDAGIYDGSTVSYFRFDPLECDYILDADGNTQKENGTYLRYDMPEGATIDVKYIAFFNSAEAVEKYESTPLFIVGPADMAASMTNFATVTDNGKYATADGNVEGSNGDGWFLPMNGASVAGKFISVVYRTSSAAMEGRCGEFFAGSGAGPTGGSSTTFNYVADGKWHMAVVDVSAHPDMTGNMAYIRYDFCNDTRDIIVDVAYIAVFETAKAAETYYALTTLASAVDPVTAGANNGFVCKDSQGADNNSAYVVGWVGFTQDMVAAGYSIDNAAIEWNGVLNPVAADDPVRDPANGGEFAQRYNISAPLTGLPFGAHNVKFYVELADGTIVIIHEIDCETKDPTAVEDSTVVFDSAENADLQGAFTFGVGAGGNSNYTAAPYLINGINQLTTKMEGTYVWTVSGYASTAKAWGTLFVRGLPNPNFGDGNYYGHDSKEGESVGCAGIYINIFEGNLRINVKGYGDGDVPVPNWVEVPYDGKDLTIADDGKQVVIYNGETLLAAIILKGDNAGMAEKATVVLADGTYTTFTDLAVASSVMGADIGFIARSADVTFDATTLKPLAGATLPAIPELPTIDAAVEGASSTIIANDMLGADKVIGAGYAIKDYNGTFQTNKNLFNNGFMDQVTMVEDDDAIYTHYVLPAGDGSGNARILFKTKYMSLVDNADYIGTKYIVFRYRTNVTTAGALYAGYEAGQSESNLPATDITWEADGEWHVYAIAVTPDNEGMINVLNLTIAAAGPAADSYFDLDYVAFYADEASWKAAAGIVD